MASNVYFALILLGVSQVVEFFGIPIFSGMGLALMFGLYFSAISYLNDAFEAEYRERR